MGIGNYHLYPGPPEARARGLESGLEPLGYENPRVRHLGHLSRLLRF